MESATEDKIAAINAQTGALQPPKMDLPPAPEPKNTNPLEIWGSTAMVLAAIGSLLTRKPLTTALNSATAVMNAYKKNDIDTANTEFERWKTATDLAVKQGNFQMEAYKSALAKANTDEKAAVAEFSAYAHAFGDETAAQVAQTRGVQGAQKLMLDQQGLNLKFQVNQQKIIQAKAFADSFKELQSKPEYQNAPPQVKAQMMAQLMPGDSLPPQAVKYLAQEFRRTGKMPSLGMKSGGARNQIIVEAAREAFGEGKTGADDVADQADTKANTQALAAITKTSKLVEAFERTAIKNSDLIVQNMDKGAGKTGVPVFDQWVRAGGAATGDPDVAKFNTAVETFKNEYAKIMSGATGAQGSTDASRREADGLINPNMSKAQIIANIALMKQEMNNRIGSLDEMHDALKQKIANPNGYMAGDVITGSDGKKYRVTGGDPSDPEIVPYTTSSDGTDDSGNDDSDFGLGEPQ